MSVLITFVYHIKIMKFHFHYQARVVYQTVINPQMHMHEIMEAFMAKQDCQPISCVSQRPLLLFFLCLLYSNLFLDRLDEIKWQVVGDGCQ